MSPVHDSRYTGILTSFGPVSREAADPDVAIHAGTVPSWGPRTEELHVGGSGWESARAEGACLGEAVERLAAHPHPADGALESSFDAWPLDEPAVPPDRWVLFHAGQYEREGFAFQPLRNDTPCRWVACRDAVSGDAWWVPEDFVYLVPRPGTAHGFGPSISTGLSCGPPGHAVLRRGLQEVIERDAVMGAWWGAYALETWPSDRALGRLSPDRVNRLLRPNLEYGFYRVRTPLSGHVTLVTIRGEDRGGPSFSIGAACGGSRAESWERSILEAVQGRHYVRFLRQTVPDDPTGEALPPRDFAEHAIYYSRYPERLDDTVLATAEPVPADADDGESESLPDLVRRLGEERVVLFRNLTPPWVTEAMPGWAVLRVLVPGLQPLHGDDLHPYLGGPLWARAASDFENLPPHPFP